MSDLLTKFMRMRGRRAPLPALILLLASPSHAAQAPTEAPAEPDYRVRIPRTAVAPFIDGRLDDPAWEQAARIDDFRQVDPVEGGTPSERTLVRLMYDSEYLYVAFRCDDSAPDQLVATQMRRDGQLFRDDRVAFIIDTFLDRRNGYFFEMNPVGGRTDALLQDNVGFRVDWDTIWHGRSSIDAGGWSAEMAIPFRSLSFDPELSRWGFNASRTIRRRNEWLRWAAPQRNRSATAPSDAGLIEGLSGIEPGRGLELRPYAKLQWSPDAVPAGDRRTRDAGLDLFYRIHGGLTAALTLNTDFADTEVDDRRVNLTRFPLFFPEKRDFFLQDAGIFEFGGIRENPLPFQSRRIGIGPDGESVDLRIGAKLTGRLDRLNIGLLDVQTAATDTLPARNLAVGRVSLNVLEASTIGAILTHGDPHSRAGNSVAGFDFNFRDPHAFGDRTLTGAAFWLKSFVPGGSGRDSAFGARLGYPNDRRDWQLSFTQVDPHYHAALGFTPRRGIREYYASIRQRWRPGGPWRRIDLRSGGTLVTDLDDDVETIDAELLDFDAETESGDMFGATYVYQREAFAQPFEVAPGLVVPPGDRDWRRGILRFYSADSRPLGLAGHVSWGGFHSGSRFDSRLELHWRPGRHLNLGVEFERNALRSGDQAFTTRLARARVNLYLTPDVSLSGFLQYDNLSDSLGINARFRWIVAPGNEVFLALNQSYDVAGSRWRSTGTELTGKAGWTFRL